MNAGSAPGRRAHREPAGRGRSVPAQRRFTSVLLAGSLVERRGTGDHVGNGPGSAPASIGGGGLMSATVALFVGRATAIGEIL